MQSVRANLQASAHSVSVAHRRLPASFHVKWSYLRASSRTYSKPKDTGIVWKPQVLRSYSPAYPSAKELDYVLVLPILMPARRSFLPTAQQQETCSLKSACLCACDCVREEENQ